MKAAVTLDRALAPYNKAIKRNPGDAVAYFNRGEMYRGVGDYDRAFADYSKAIELNPRMPTPASTAVSRTGTRGITTAPSPTTARRSTSIPTTSLLASTAV